MCNITQGITPTDCKQSLPGVRPTRIWAWNYTDMLALVDGTNDSNWANITLKTGKQAYKFDVHKDTANFTEELSAADNSGDYYNQTAQFRVIDDSLPTVLAARGLIGSELVFVMQKRNGTFYVLGDLEGLKLGEGTMHETGSAAGDDSGRMFSFDGIVENQAKQLITGGTYDEANIIALLDGLLLPQS